MSRRERWEGGAPAAVHASLRESFAAEAAAQANADLVINAGHLANKLHLIAWKTMQTPSSIAATLVAGCCGTLARSTV